MTIQEIATVLNCTLLAGESGLQNQAQGGYTSDLLSDVMGHASEGLVWITLQTHLNVMAIAGLKELAAVIIINQLPVGPEVIQRANAEGIPLLSTPLSGFECSGKLYALLQNA